MKYLTGLFTFAALTLLTVGAASAQCQRHFYNNSSVVWTVGIVNGVCNGLPLCQVKPHTTSTLIYFPTPGSPITISSPFYHDVFIVSFCHINHSGSTGAIAVNDPADGDVTTCGAGWRCPALRSKKRAKPKR